MKNSQLPRFTMVKKVKSSPAHYVQVTALWPKEKWEFYAKTVLGAISPTYQAKTFPFVSLPPQKPTLQFVKPEPYSKSPNRWNV